MVRSVVVVVVGVVSSSGSVQNHAKHLSLCAFESIVKVGSHRPCFASVQHRWCHSPMEQTQSVVEAVAVASELVLQSVEGAPSS